MLRPGGTLVLSTHQPFLDFQLSQSDNYYRVEEWDDVWDKRGAKIAMRYRRRLLEVILTPVIEAGFLLDRVSEGEIDSL